GFGSHMLRARQIIGLSDGELLALGDEGFLGATSGQRQQGSAYALNEAGQSDRFWKDKTPTGVFMGGRELADGRLLFGSEGTGCATPKLCLDSVPAPPYTVQRFLKGGVLDTSYGNAGTYTAAVHAGNAAILSDGAVIGLGATYNVGRLLGKPW